MFLESLETPLDILHWAACLILITVILIQPGRAGGLGGMGGGGAQQVFGGGGSGNALAKMTWITAGIFFFTSMTLAYISSSMHDSLADEEPTISAPKK